MSGKRSFGAIEKLKSGRYRDRYRVDGRWINLQLAAEIYLHATVDHGRRIAERMDELAAEPSSVRPIRCRARARR